MTYSYLIGIAMNICIAVLSLGTLACLVRAIIGPSVADRLVAVNMIGTQVIGLICLIAARSGESGFIDIAIVYALLNFLAVAVLTKILRGKGKKS